MDSGLGASNTGEGMFHPASQRKTVPDKENNKEVAQRLGEQEDMFSKGECEENGEYDEEPCSDETQLNSEDWLRIQNSPPSESLLTPRPSLWLESVQQKKSEFAAESSKTDNGSVPMELTPIEPTPKSAPYPLDTCNSWTGPTKTFSRKETPRKVTAGDSIQNAVKRHPKKIREAKENALSSVPSSNQKRISRQPLADITSKFVNMELQNEQIYSRLNKFSEFREQNSEGTREDLRAEFFEEDGPEFQGDELGKSNSFKVVATVLEHSRLPESRTSEVRPTNFGTGRARQNQSEVSETRLTNNNPWMIHPELGQNFNQLQNFPGMRLTNDSTVMWVPSRDENGTFTQNDSLGMRIRDNQIASLSRPPVNFHQVQTYSAYNENILLESQTNLEKTRAPIYYILKSSRDQELLPEDVTNSRSLTHPIKTPVFDPSMIPTEEQTLEGVILESPTQQNPFETPRRVDSKDLSDALGHGQSEAVQTDLNLPDEDVQQRKNVIQHVRLLRGLMNVKQYDVKFGNSGKGRRKKRSSSTHYLRQGKQSASKNLEVEVIDLVSSPELEAIDAAEKGKLKPRRLNFIKEHEKDNTENLRFALRNVDQKEEALESMKIVQAYVAAETMTRPAYVNDNWTGSLLELSCDTLMRIAVADECQGVGLVTRLCEKLLDNIEKDREGLQAENHEGLVNVLLKLCESLNVAADLVDRLVDTITRIQETFMHNTDNLLPHIGLMESCYHFLRLLNEILKRLEDNANETGTVLRPTRTPQKDIMNLWRCHWRPTGAPETTQTEQVYMEHSERLVKLENLLKCLLENLPLFCPLVMQCMETARNIHMKATNSFSKAAGQG